jgi:hypothetical protein
VLAGARDAVVATRAFSAPTWAPARDARLVALTRLDRQRRIGGRLRDRGVTIGLSTI